MTVTDRFVEDSVVMTGPASGDEYGVTGVDGPDVGPVPLPLVAATVK